MSVKYIAATDYLLDVLLHGGASTTSIQLSELAVSQVSLEWILADVELDLNLSASERTKWRTNLTNFRNSLTQAGGEIPALSTSALERWGKVMLLDLKHDYNGIEEEMPVEERLVVATAADSGWIYLTPRRDWNGAIRDEFGLAIEEL